VPIAWNEVRGREIIDRHAGREGSLLPILHDLQATFACIPPEAVIVVAEVLNLTRAEVHGVVSFYHDFRNRPAGRHMLRLCRAEACQSMGGEAMARRALDHFGLEWGGTTPDGNLTVEATYCLGLCACGPSAMLDGEPIGRLRPASLDDIAREVAVR
jgi:formate dehydrogenase subunit gamma